MLHYSIKQTISISLPCQSDIRHTEMLIPKTYATTCCMLSPIKYCTTYSNATLQLSFNAVPIASKQYNQGDNTVIKHSLLASQSYFLFIKVSGFVIMVSGFVTKPDAFVTKPNGIFTKPDGLFLKPEAFYLKPDGSYLKPNGFFIKPDAFVIKPEVFVIKPEAFILKEYSFSLLIDFLTKN